MKQIDGLTPQQQEEVLAYTSRLTRPRGESGKTFLTATAHIHIDPTDLAAMQQAIDEEFEKVDLGGW